MASERPAGNPNDDAPSNYSVQLDKDLRERIKKAMKVRGTRVTAEFHRQALLLLCRQTEDELRAKNPEEYRRIYSSNATPEAAKG